MDKIEEVIRKFTEGFAYVSPEFRKEEKCYGVCKDCQIIWDKVKKLENEIHILQDQLFELNMKYNKIILQKTRKSNECSRRNNNQDK